MLGELLRADLTKRCIARRQKWYTLSGIIPTATPAGVYREASLQVDKGGLFLWTNTLANQEKSTVPSAENITLSLSLGSNHRRLSRAAMLLDDYASQLNACEENADYVLLEPGDTVRANFAPAYIPPNSPVTVRVVLMGIEYIMPS